MEVWKNKVAIVTGAGQGIGAQITKDLVKIGIKVIGFEPSEEKAGQMLENMRSWGKVEGQLVPCKCDISNDDDLKKAFEGIVVTYGGVDLLINNAATGKEDLISTGNIQNMKDTIDVNIYGMIACTRMAIESMKKKGIRGQIININSISGHYMPSFAKPMINVYIASKKAMTAFNEVLRHELQQANLNINVTSISPGIVKTDLFKNAAVSFINDEFFDTNPHLTVQDVSNTILMILTAPRSICIKDMIIHALHEIY